MREDLPMKKQKRIVATLIIALLCLMISMPVNAATKISKSKATLIKGQTLQLKVTGTKSQAKWSSSKKSVATVSVKGKVTAKKKGAATITAKIGKKKYTCKVTVESPALSKKSVTINAGKSTTIKLNGTKQKVTWKTSNSKVATVKNGKITGKSAGTATITATVLKKKYTCKVTVKGKSVKAYGEGMHKVGKDIPAGEYVLFTTGRISGYFSISRDSSGLTSSIIENDNFEYNSIIKVNKGEYLELNRCKAVPINSAKISTKQSGMFKVGRDIPAGEYVLFTIGEMSGYYEINQDAAGINGKILDNDNFEYNSIIRVKNGEYLKLNRCRMEKSSNVTNISTNGPGMFRVGKDISAGEYLLLPTGELSAYYEINSNIGSENNIVDNGNFKGSQYITVKNGQYLKLNRCKISNKNEMSEIEINL